MPLRADLDALRGEVRGLRSAEPVVRPRPENAGGGVPGFVCYFCRQGRHRRDNCPDLLKMILDGVVHLNENNRVCLGRYEKGAHEVWFPSDGTPGRDHIRYLIGSNKQPEEIRVSSIRLGINSSSAAINEDSEEELMEHGVGVAAARTNLRGKAK